MPAFRCSEEPSALTAHHMHHFQVRTCAFSQSAGIDAAGVEPHATLRDKNDMR